MVFSDTAINKTLNLSILLFPSFECIYFNPHIFNHIRPVFLLPTGIRTPNRCAIPLRWKWEMTVGFGLWIFISSNYALLGQLNIIIYFQKANY